MPLKLDLFDQWSSQPGSRAWVEQFHAHRDRLVEQAKVTSSGRQVGTSERGNLKYIGSVNEDLYWAMRRLHGEEMDTPDFWHRFFAEHPTFATKEQAAVGDRAWSL